MVGSLSVADVPTGRWRSHAGLTPFHAVNSTAPQHGDAAPAGSLPVGSLSVADVPTGRWRSHAGLAPFHAMNSTAPQHGDAAPAPAVIQTRRAARLELRVSRAAEPVLRAGPAADPRHPARCVGPNQI